MMSIRTNSIELSNGEVRAFIEQEAIHIMAVTTDGDPVELTADEARTLAAALLVYCEKVDA
jgi:hypothetical protein